MKLDELKKPRTKLNPKQVQQILLLVVKHARLKKREQATGFKG